MTGAADAGGQGAGMPADHAPAGAEPLTKQDFEALARFRLGIRRYLRFSEEAVRSHGLTLQQYQLLLALKGFPGREWATVRELADRLLLRHHSVVELITRAQRHGLVRRAPDPDDARAVRVSLTADGQRTLARLSALHRDQLRYMHTTLALPTWHDEPATHTAAGNPSTPTNGNAPETADRHTPAGRERAHADAPADPTDAAPGEAADEAADESGPRAIGPGEPVDLDTVTTERNPETGSYRVLGRTAAGVRVLVGFLGRQGRSWHTQDPHMTPMPGKWTTKQAALERLVGARARS